MYTSNKKPLGLTPIPSLSPDDNFIVGDTSDTSEVVKTITYSDLVTQLTSDLPTSPGGGSGTVVVSGNQVAANDTTYHNVATATYTDPTPSEGKGFIVFVRNGTATVGGTGYSTTGTIIHRIFHSGAWANYVYQVSSTFAAASHTHTIANVTGLQTALDGKASALGADDNYVTDAEKAALHTHANKAVLDATTASFTTADETKLDGLVSNATHTGDVTGATALTLATVNSNVGSFGLASSVAQFTVNAKGLITAAANVAISVTASAVSDFAATVRATVLTGLSTATGTAVTAADSILVAIGKLQKQNTDQDTTIAGKANTVHTHVIADTTGLQTALDGKAATSHTHTKSHVTDFQHSIIGAEHTFPGGTTTFLRADGTFATPAGGGGGAISGQATVNFGASTTETSIARVTVNTASVATGSIVMVSPAGISTATHDPDDYQWDNISGYVSNIVNGVSFDIIGVAPNGSFGEYVFNYVIN